MITGSVGSPAEATMVGPPVVVPHVAHVSELFVTGALVSQINYKPLFPAVTCCRAASSAYTSPETLLAQGH